MLPRVCPVIDHRRLRNKAKTSVTRLAAPCVSLFCSYPHFNVMCGLKRSCSLGFNGDKGSSINYFHLDQEWTLLVFLFSNEVRNKLCATLGLKNPRKILGAIIRTSFLNLWDFLTITSPLEVHLTTQPKWAQRRNLNTPPRFPHPLPPGDK